MPPRFTHKKRRAKSHPHVARDEAPLPLSPGFSQSDAAYQQVLTYLRERLGRHPTLDYEMKDFHPDYTVALLDAEGRIEGFFSTIPCVRVAMTPKPRRKHLEIGILETVEGQRGKGVGRRMLEEIAAIGRRGLYRFVRTFVIESAAPFYRKCGYEVDLSVPGFNSSLRL